MKTLATLAAAAVASSTADAHDGSFRSANLASGSSWIGTTSSSQASFSPLGLVDSVPRGGGSSGGDDDGESENEGKVKDHTKNRGDTDDERDGASKQKGRFKKDRRKKKDKPKTTRHQSSASDRPHPKTGDHGTGRRHGSHKSSPNDGPKGSKHSEAKSTASKDFKTSAIVEEILTHGDDYYLILGLKKSASLTSREIQKAYRRRAVQTHPDKTDGDRRAFDKVAEAYDVLSDENKKSIYDRFGKRGLDDPMSGASGANGMSGNHQDFFSSMFQQQRQQQQARARQNPAMRYQMQVSLEDLYMGATQDVTISPQAMFNAASSQRQRSKRVQVPIPRGTLSGQKIVLSGEIDFVQDSYPGDLILIVVQAPHPRFTRKANDLAIEMTISLKESICGLNPNRFIRHLDGRMLKLTSPVLAESETPVLIQTGDVHVIKGQGMPKRNRPGEFGDLYVQYTIRHPSAAAAKKSPLTMDERQELYRLLSKLEGQESSSIPDAGNSASPNRYRLRVASPGDFGRASGPAELEEEEEYPGMDGNSDPFGFGNFGSFGDGMPKGFFYSSSMGGGDGPPECQQM